jgi:DNA modification methylase
MKELKIDKEFEKLIPKLTDEEFNQLEENCKDHGIQDSIKIWSDENIIIDGHNRYKIAEKNNLQYETEYMNFDNRGQVVEWMLNNQLGRRNLNPDQLSIIRGKLYNLHKYTNNKDNSERKKCVNKSANELSKLYKVSPRTIQNDGQFVEEHPEEAEKVLQGELTKKDIKKKEKEKKLESKRKEILEQTKEYTKNNPPIVFNESYKTWLDKMNKCDLLLTDPPYSTDVKDINKFVDDWLFKALSKVKKTGAAYIFIGAYPEEVKAYLNAKIPNFIELKQILIWEYKNILGNNPKNRYKLNYQNILFYKAIENNYFDCPIINEQWAVHSINAPDGRIGDRYHSWQKPIKLAERLIRHSTKENDIIFDPFVCTGTFVLAANKLNRNGFGCDINLDNLNISIERGCKLNNE